MGNRIEPTVAAARITKRAVDAAQPMEGRRYYLWDCDLKGFGLLVLPSGVKSYVFRYRTSEGRKRLATIGKHGRWTPDEARARADAWRQAVNAERDPLTERKERRHAPTIAEVLDAYVDSERFKSKAPSTRSTDRGRIERHLKPTLGAKPVGSLRPSDVERAHAAIRLGKTAADVRTRPRGRARVSGGPGTARKAIKLLHAVFEWAIREGLAGSNPCASVATGTDGNRHVILEDADAYSRMVRTLERMEAERRIRAPVADAIRLIALTGARRGEIAGLRWSHVDLKRGLLTLPPRAHKTGHRSGQARVIGLPAAGQAIVARQPEGAPEDLVFRPSRGDRPLELSKPWTSVRVEAGLPATIGLHGLRHSLASHMAMGGAAAAEIMTALGHSELSTAQRYVHWAQDARQGLAERAASVALAGMTEASGEAGGDIVNLPKGRSR
jgi:integrase